MHVVKFLVHTMACKRYTVSEALDRIVNLRSDDSGDESDTSSDEADNVIDSGDRRKCLSTAMQKANDGGRVSVY